MEKNIFEGAKFGDKFLTRDGRIAVLLFVSLNGVTNNFVANHRYHCFVDGHSVETVYNSQGAVFKNEENGNDIISRYKEPIDEEKLNEISTKECIMILDKYNKDIDLSDVIELMILAYRHVYRKAKEE